jgi:serine protease AprX
MVDAKYLPIVVSEPLSSDFRQPKGGGGGRKLFGDVTPAVRQNLASQISDVKDFFASSFAARPSVPAVARISLKLAAVAKTHFPKTILNESTCPVIGCDGLGQHLVSATPEGLDALSEVILTADGQEDKAGISSFEGILPYTSQDALTEAVDSLFAESRQRPLQLVLFRHDTGESLIAMSPLSKTIEVENAFLEIAGEEKLNNLEYIDYADNLRAYCLSKPSRSSILKLANFVGTRQISRFANYRIVRTASNPLGVLPDDMLPLPKAGEQYGIVGLIDSGTYKGNPRIQAWVLDRHDWTAASQQVTDHGTFIAGLLAHSRRLNHGDKRFPSVSSRIVDIAALDANGIIDEYDLITVIEDSIKRFPQVRVWALSLETCGSPSQFDKFSELGAALDYLTEQHRVLFVVAAGNYPRMRSWPPTSGIDGADRIGSPGDSLFAVTVGSIAHRDTESTCVKSGEPSPFSRRGPGPAYAIKPELIHIGGNCDVDGNCHQTGVISTDGDGGISEDIGTSFPVAPVASLAANIFRELDVPGAMARPELVKALLVHSAFIRSAPIQNDRFNYCGLGMPDDIDGILNCLQSSATIIMQPSLFGREFFEKKHFPMPLCLNVRKGRSSKSYTRAEAFMTLLYQPPVDWHSGPEYCRTNVDASLGIVRRNKEGKLRQVRQLHPVARELEEGMEKDLIEKGMKWSPIKLYYRNFKKTRSSKNWRLVLRMLHRSGFAQSVPQGITLIMTIRDPNNQAFVYDSLIREMTRLNWKIHNLQIRSRVK